MADNTLYLLDGHALVYQYHFAFRDRPLINSKGVNTSAIVGFTRMLWDLLQNSNPSHIAVVFDPSGETFRTALYREYKANREEQPEDIRAALPKIREIVEAMNIPVKVVPNYEADDVIGTLAKQAEGEGYDVFMVTPDKDYGQLVSDRVHQYRPSRMGSGVTVLRKRDILDKWDIERPEQVIDVLALQGDSSDNIPGVPGIGPKTAAKLLKEFGSLDGIYEGIERVRGKNQERLREFEEQARMSYKLATIDVETPVRFDASAFCVDPMDRDKLAALFGDLEIRSLAKAMLGAAEAGQTVPSASGQINLFDTGKQVAHPSAAIVKARGVPEALTTLATSDAKYHLVQTEEEIARLLTLLGGYADVCFDTETTSVNAIDAELVGLAWAVEENEAYYVPVPAEEAAAQALVDRFKPVLEDAAVAKTGQNLKYDVMVLARYGVRVAGPVRDTMLMHYLLSPELKHNLNYMAETYLKYAPQPIEELIGRKGKDQGTMRDVPVEKAAAYAGEDADITLRLARLLYPKLEREGMIDLYERVEAPLVYVLRDMETNGVKVDSGFLVDYAGQLKERMAELERRFREETQVGPDFNIGSPKQIGELLFDRMNIPYKGRKTKTGAYVTDEAKLTYLAHDYPIVSTLLEIRKLKKLLGTYVEALPKLVNERTGMVHSSFNQAAVATGRLSSSNPNLQNIPMRTGDGREIRKAFVPRGPGRRIVAADYSQIELRLIAQIAGETAMLEAFGDGRDIHRATAALVFGVPFEEVSDDQRRQAKTINFAIIYGAGANRVSEELDTTRQEAADLIEQYFETYPGLQKFMESQRESARRQGYVETVLGRRRYLRDINSANNNLRAYAERNAANTPIQGTAADLMKLAMIRLHDRMAAEGMESLLTLQVHDELVFDAPEGEVERLRAMAAEEMVAAMPEVEVRLMVESGVGENWLEAH